MSRWFRFYSDALRNPKVAKLTDAQFRLWVELMAIASDNDGAIPALDDLKHVLKRRLDHLSRGLKDLISAGLIDALGNGYEPHNWSKHQYKSDTSKDRVALHRSKRNVTVTPPDTETETELPLDKSNGASPNSDKVFWDGAKAYLGGQKSGSMIGKWIKDYGKQETAEAITAAQLDRAVEPIAFITGALKNRKRGRAESEYPIC